MFVTISPPYTLSKKGSLICKCPTRNILQRDRMRTSGGADFTLHLDSCSQRAEARRGQRSLRSRSAPEAGSLHVLHSECPMWTRVRLLAQPALRPSRRRDSFHPGCLPRAQPRTPSRPPAQHCSQAETGGRGERTGGSRRSPAGRESPRSLRVRTVSCPRGNHCTASTPSRFAS